MQQKLEAIKRYKWMCTHSALAAMTGDSQRFCHETGLVLSHLELYAVERLNLQALERFLECGYEHYEAKECQYGLEASVR